MREVMFGTETFDKVTDLLGLEKLPYGVEYAKITFDTNGRYELQVEGLAVKPEAGEDAVS